MAGSTNSSDPTLTLPASEQVASDGTIAVTGASYTDSFAQSNPGAMYLNIEDTSGVLSGYYPAQGSVPSADSAGNGTNAITFQGSYADVQDIINSLTYAATTASGTDSIDFDIWNQAGVETTGTIPVTIGGTANASETWTGASSGDWNTPSNWSGGAVPASGDTVVIPDGTKNTASLSNATLTGETIQLDNTAGGLGPTVDLADVTLGSGTTLDGIGNIQVAGSLTIGAGATLLPGSTFDIAPEEPSARITVVNDGVIAAGAGTAMTVQSNVTNNGTILTNGGLLDLAGPLTNDGSIELDQGTILAGYVTGGTITFAGSGLLGLGATLALSDGATIAGFGPGDEIASTGSLTGNGLTFGNGTLDITNGGSVVQAIPLTGTLGLGNFEINGLPGPGTAPIHVAYAPGGGPSGESQFSPDISAPATGTVASGGTLGLGSVAISNAGSMTLQITASSGSLYMNGASGSGTDDLSISNATSESQINAALASLSYVGGASGGNATIEITATASSNGYGDPTTSRYIPVLVNGGTISNGPTLTEPSSESIGAGGTVAVDGSYSDSFAAGNPGEMYLSISDTSGTLYAHYPDVSMYEPVPGYGTNTLTFQGSYTAVQYILGNLVYVAGSSAGSDSINFDVWNQAGVETTDSIPVTVTAPGNGSTEIWTGAASEDWNNPANWSYGAVPTSGDTAVIPADTSHNATLSNAVLSGETITLDDSNGTPSVNFTDVTLGAGSVLDGNGGDVDVSGTLTIDAGATYAPTGLVLVNPINVSAPTTVVNDGTIVSAATGDFVGLGSDVVNNGTILDTGGHIQIGETLVNNGTVLDYGGGFEVDGTIIGGIIDLSGGGALQLAAPMAMTGGATVAGFSQASDIAIFQPIDALTFNDNTLDISAGGTLVEAIRFTGGLGLGNFEIEHSINVPYSEDSAVAFAAPGEPATFLNSGDTPDISAPAVGTVAASGTLGLGDVSLTNGGTMTLSITAGSGTLYMNGASGSGTNHLSISAETSPAQINADLASLTYVAAAGSSPTLDVVEITADAEASTSGTIETSRYIPISVTGGGSGGPTLNEPSSETLSPSGTVAVGGSYADSFAQSNPGDLFLSISDSSGTLSATDASGQAVVGSGTDSIALSTDYVDVNAILASLHYTAGATAGSDTINFQVWNQAGVETTGSTAVTIDPPGENTTMAATSAKMLADFLVTGAAPPTVVPSGNGPGNVAMLSDTANSPIGIPLTLPH
jgi:fibronectin-binding autotransporter adhesin